jgi:hypothetical protein
MAGALPNVSAAAGKAEMTTEVAPGANEPDGAPVAASAARNGGAAGSALSEDELRVLQQLQQRDREVRAHEMAHVAAGAGLVTRGASYSYQTGPDGQRYAIGGEVSIDTSPGRTPEESLAKADRIRAAALAPAEPSGQDRQVAAQAARMASEARMEIARRAFQENAGATPAEAPASESSYRGGQAERAYRAEPRAPAMFEATA